MSFSLYLIDDDGSEKFQGEWDDRKDADKEMAMARERLDGVYELTTVEDCEIVVLDRFDPEAETA